MNIAIIGAGLYGCHLAISLKTSGYDVDLHEMRDDIFTGASTHNSYRIHKGYHYPRSGKTREMCKEDEAEFVRHYSHLISPEKDNAKIFCVADDERTLIDYITMKLIMRGSGLPFEEVSLEELDRMGFRNIEGGFKVHEAIFLVDKAKNWFRRTLIDKGVHLKLDCPMDKIEFMDESRITIAECAYDFVINCTYNQAIQHTSTRYEHYFDPCLSLMMASKKIIREPGA
uniref:FAD dependent oxidoreductase n=1 Tax=Candidatus Kentrum sp. TC TaxID=2126339 RepID=A0A450YME0_9GAMM|nr:MAG: FAD dependent oxidoreductase [Candidatus Kentron sp. TC]